MDEQINQTKPNQNQTIKFECGPGTVDVHVAHDVQDVGSPWLSLFKTKTYSYNKINQMH